MLYNTYLIDTHNFQFILVTGGFDGLLGGIDSTEIFSDNIWSTLDAKLPVPMDGLRVATINNRVLAFGNPLF